MHSIEINPMSCGKTCKQKRGHFAAFDTDRPNQPGLDAAITQACSMIAPAWPLDRAIAVNPHWARVGMPLRQVAARVALLGGIRVFPARSLIKEAWTTGRIRREDLLDALETLATSLTSEQCIAALENDSLPQPLPLLIDLVDKGARSNARLSWRQAVTHQVSQTCASYFDVHQAEWRPAGKQGLYAFWRETIQHDHGIGILMGLPRLADSLAEIPATSGDAERWAIQRLGLPANCWADYLEAVLLTVNGWASWCAYLGWQAGLDGKTDPHLRELLAIRLAWGAILLDCGESESTEAAFQTLLHDWKQLDVRLAKAASDLAVDEAWQAALDTAYQRELRARLKRPALSTPNRDDVAVQAAFCIDVRSERMRRALESVAPNVQTIGFAGFFGLPIAYTPLGTSARRPQLPGLLPPRLEVTERIQAIGSSLPSTVACETEAAGIARRARLQSLMQWARGVRQPGAAFSTVEAIGVCYLSQMWRWIKPSRAGRYRDNLVGLSSRYRVACRPALQSMDNDAKAALAKQVLGGLGISGQLAPLVLLVGHGSQTNNNAHAAALDCGACCGQTGEINARSLAQVLNDPDVRSRLAQEGVHVPQRTWFVAALHNTTTDEIEGFDLDLLPDAARTAWDALQGPLARACDQVRDERAPAQGLDSNQSPGDLLAALQRRANDGAQTRPEWGLAGNAAFVIAPRYRTRGIALDGRVFLHDYAADQDRDGHLLEQLLTAPMLVTHWINWQYHASVCAPAHYGSGNKLLHNVVGGHLGVFEGNGGDLRIGLARQSLHDGTCWMHDPVRLTVIIDAPVEAIARVLRKHKVVRDLVANGWVHLQTLDDANTPIHWAKAPTGTGSAQVSTLERTA